MGSTADSASKKTRVDELDRISSLPSDITQQILPFLPIKEAVRTSVLSSIWRHRWTMIRPLVFDDDCVPFKEKVGTTGKKTIKNIVLLHSGSVDTFKLSTVNFPVGGRSIDRWIHHLLKSMKEFILKKEGNEYKISSCLFLYPDLTHLELQNCLLKPPATFKGFPRLKSLTIQEVTVAQDVLEKLITCSTLLERMSLCDLRRIDHLNIDAPNLQFLSVGGRFESFKLNNTPNLVGMKVTGFRGVKTEVDFLKVLLLSSPLQELEISFGLFKESMLLYDNQSCTFKQLRALKITGFCGSAKKELNFIQFLLSSSPVLERLTLQPTSVNVSWKLTKILQGFKHVKKNLMDPSTSHISSSSSENSSDEDSSAENSFDEESYDENSVLLAQVLLEKLSYPIFSCRSS